MPTTAYSKTFNGEFQVTQLEDLHNKYAKELNLHPDFRAFVKLDVECPCCNVPNAIVVSEGFSSNSKDPVKQAHFAFKNNEGTDSHLKFCDFYSGKDKQNLSTNDCLFKNRKSNDLITEIVRKFICGGIENNIFSQSDIRNMRLWFLELRSNNSFYIQDSKIALKVLRQMVINDNNNKSNYIFNKSKIESGLLNFDEEVYKLLSFRLPKKGLPDREKDFTIYYYLSLKTTTEKAIRISIKDSGSYTYDRNLLNEKYRTTVHVAYKIARSIPELKKKYGNSLHNKINNINSIMAYSALLLFICDWNIESALEIHNEKIANIKTVKNMNLGNVIGINPFIYYQECQILKFSSEWEKNLGTDLQDEFNKAKQELMTYLLN